MRIPKQTLAIFHDCRGYSFVWGASNSGLPTRYLRDPVEDLIQRIVTAVRTIPCQEEIYVQADILQLGGESNRYREGRVSVAGAVSHIRQASYSIGEYLFTPESATLLHRPTGEVTLIPRREADILQLLCKGGGNIIPTQNILLSLWADVNFLISNLPVEAIDDDQEREKEYPGDFEDSEELEDEVVECEKLIAQANKLLATVREHYLPSEVATAAPAAAAPQTKLVRKKRYINWSNVILIGIIIAIIAYIIINDAV